MIVLRRRAQTSSREVQSTVTPWRIWMAEPDPALDQLISRFDATSVAYQPGTTQPGARAGAVRDQHQVGNGRAGSDR
jgi:hypothetical protein